MDQSVLLGDRRIEVQFLVGEETFAFIIDSKPAEARRVPYPICTGAITPGNKVVGA
jgi:hypothetical protein